MQLDRPAAQGVAGYTEVRVWRARAVRRHGAQVGINGIGLKVGLVEQVVGISANFELRALSQPTGRRQAKSFGQAAIYIVVAWPIQEVALDSGPECGNSCWAFTSGRICAVIVTLEGVVAS